MPSLPAGPVLLSIAVAGALALPLSGPAVTPVAGSGAEQVVHYDGLQLAVPAGWPVVDLTRDPHACVRFDRHVVYLGTTPRDQQCPAHLVGRTEAVQLSPGTAAPPDARTQSQHGLSLAVAASAVDRQVRAHVERHGVDLLATFGRDRAVVDRALASLAPDGSAAASPAMTPSATTLPAQTGSVTGGTPYGGEGFDACAAPSLTTMNDWLASPYRALGVYVGGAARACAQPNLTPSWVTSSEQLGWRLVPLYVGLQAPCTDFSDRIDPATAATQGTAAADDAATQASALGMPAASPVYFDMEYYDRTVAGCSQAVLDFLDAWSRELHAKGLLSGVYGSGSAAITDLSGQVGNTSYALPNDIWIADWNGKDTVWGESPYVPDGAWSSHQRLHQYTGGGNETWGGATINIDRDAVDADIVGADESGGAPYGPEIYGPAGTAAGFTTSGGWSDASPYGLLGRMQSAPSSGATDAAQATWAPSLAPGQYAVSAYVPRVATANVTYTVTDAAGTTRHAVAQGAHPGQWVALGQFVAGTGGITVTLGTGGDAVNATSVAADAMMFHYTGAAVTAAPTITGVAQPSPTAGQPVTLTGTASPGATVDVYVDNATLSGFVSVGSTTADAGGSWSFTFTPSYTDQVYVRDAATGQSSATVTVRVTVKVSIDAIRYLGRDARGRCVTRFLGGTYPYVPGAAVWIRDASTSPSTPIGSASVTQYGGSGRYDSRFGLTCGATYRLFALVSGVGTDGKRYADNGASPTTTYRGGS